MRDGDTASTLAPEEQLRPAAEASLRRSEIPIGSLLLESRPLRLTCCCIAGEQEESAFSRAFFFTALSVMSTNLPLSLAARWVLCRLICTTGEARAWRRGAVRAVAAGAGGSGGGCRPGTSGERLRLVVVKLSGEDGAVPAAVGAAILLKSWARMAAMPNSRASEA